jgi:hypothetical protein
MLSNGDGTGAPGGTGALARESGAAQLVKELGLTGHHAPFFVFDDDAVEQLGRFIALLNPNHEVEEPGT